MAEQKRPKKPQSVFVICEPRSDIHLLIEILQDSGLRTLNLEGVLVHDGVIASTTQDLIAKADFVCAVLQERNSPRVYIELGYAIGVRRPIAIISKAGSLPTDLRDKFWIKAPLDDRSALTFQLQAFIANLDAHKPKRTVKPAASGKRLTPSSKVMAYESPQSGVEGALLEALQASIEIESIAPQPRGDGERGYIPDFAVWLAVTPKVIESPVVIEVKGRHLGQPAIDHAVDQLKTFSQAGGVRTGLLVVDGHPGPALRVANLSPLIFVLSLNEARELLTHGRLVETLRRERNRVAHSAS